MHRRSAAKKAAWSPCFFWQRKAQRFNTASTCPKQKVGSKSCGHSIVLPLVRIRDRLGRPSGSAAKTCLGPAFRGAPRL
jgi:hypothetical protein